MRILIQPFLNCLDAPFDGLIWSTSLLSAISHHQNWIESNILKKELNKCPCIACLFDS